MDACRVLRLHRSYLYDLIMILQSIHYDIETMPNISIDNHVSAALTLGISIDRLRERKRYVEEWLKE